MSSLASCIVFVTLFQMGNRLPNTKPWEVSFVRSLIKNKHKLDDAVRTEGYHQLYRRSKVSSLARIHFVEYLMIPASLFLQGMSTIWTWRLTNNLIVDHWMSWRHRRSWFDIGLTLKRFQQNWWNLPPFLLVAQE